MPPLRNNYDAIVIGSGPNGLAAAITVAQAGHSVLVCEAEDTIGGGTRSAELTLPGFIHDLCSCVHPMAAGSPFLGRLPLERFGLRWIQPHAAAAHPFDDGTAALLTRSIAESSAQFGRDAAAVRALFEPLAKSWDALWPDLLSPLRIPRHPWALTRFGWHALRPAKAFAEGKFKMAKTRAVFAGMAAHSMLPLERWASSSFGIVLWATCHAIGWPFAAGGSQAIANALAGYLATLGGEVIAGRPVRTLDELPESRAILCDLTPRQYLRIAGQRVTRPERRRFEKYRYGPGVFKMDWALDAPVPWKAAECTRAGTVHIGGTLEEIAESERAAWNGVIPERPFIVFAQPSLFDPARAPNGKHTAWGYCHVPNGSTMDMSERIETQIERFAPGFRERILARSAMSPRDLEGHNANLVGGDIGGGSMELGQLFTRPSRHLYSTSIPNVFLCSASTPPGPGVHGMCGHFAALRALRKCF